MDGSIVGPELTTAAHASRRHVRRRPTLRSRLYKFRWFALFVVLPSAVVGTYMLGFAADQYETEARFIVRAPQSTAPAMSGLGQLLGLSGGLTPSQMESFSVGDYLESHDAVTALEKRIPLVEMFRRPEADPLFRLWDEHPSAEKLLKYYRKHVEVTYGDDTGITKLTVHAFRPADAKLIAETLLELGEARVNALNERSMNDTLVIAKHEVAEAEDRVAEAQKNMTAFRLHEQDINPEKTSTAQLTLVAQMQGQLAQARAQQIGMSASIRQDSPQYVALSNRIHALESQVLAESAKLTGANASMAPALANYEELTLKREFAATQYTAAQASYENAKLQAMRQQLYVVRVVEPNLPESALYPKSYTITLTVALSLLVAYCIGWLIAAGVREHAA
jgi:capsular polysaccharide transport system permease protein